MDGQGNVEPEIVLNVHEAAAGREDQARDASVPNPHTHTLSLSLSLTNLIFSTVAHTHSTPLAACTGASAAFSLPDA